MGKPSYLAAIFQVALVGAQCSFELPEGDLGAHEQQIARLVLLIDVQQALRQLSRLLGIILLQLQPCQGFQRFHA